eukprot:jgi/Chlat1/7485/Chrsp60S07002
MEVIDLSPEGPGVSQGSSGQPSPTAAAVVGSKQAPNANANAAAAAAAASASPIAVVLQYWKEFDLERTRSKLDEQGLKIADNQETSLKNRRKLAEVTRDFKKNPGEDKSKSFGPLLKSYQEEIDVLTKRSKFAENAFLSVYQLLYEAPDPAPALATASEECARTGELERENHRMRMELEEYRAESANLKNQQVTIRRLEERNRLLEAQMEDKVREMVEMRQRTMEADSQKQVDAVREREAQLQRQVEEAKDMLAAMQSQLFELKTQSDEERAARQAELDMVLAEVDRAQARMLAMEREKLELKSKLDQTQLGDTSQMAPKSDWESDRDSLEADAAAKERTISQLHQQISELEESILVEREAHKQALQDLHQEVTSKDRRLQRLQAELVSELRRQVKLLQAVGYNSIEEDWALAGEGTAAATPTLPPASSRLAEKEKELAHTLQRVSNLQSEAARQTELISKLEEDIRTGVGGGGRAGANGDDEWESNVVDRGAAQLVQGAASSSKLNNGSDESEPSMLSMVCGQRDRFRARVLELEEAANALIARVGAVTAELEACKADNVSLYEKLRYVQGYQNRARKPAGDIEQGNEEVEGRYRKLYEDTVNPFSEFSKQERDKRRKDLRFHDRIAYSLLGNKFARAFIFVYFVCLHFLIFVILYRQTVHRLQHLDIIADELPSKQQLLASNLQLL